MQKIDDGFRSLKTARAPELWGDISRRTPRTPPGPSLPRRIAVAALALALAGTGSWLAARAFLASEPGVKPAEEVPGVVTPRLGSSASFEGTHGGGPIHGYDSVWLPIHREPPGTDVLLRLDPQTLDVLARIPIDAVPGWEVGNEGMAVGLGAVWVGGGTGDVALLQRVDALTDQVAATIEIDGSFVGDVAIDANGVWAAVMASNGDSSLVRVDPASNEVAATISLPGDWAREVFAHGDRILVRVRQGEESSIVAVDPTTDRIVSQEDLGISYAAFAGSNGWLWTGVDDRIARLDPSTGRVVERYELRTWISYVALSSGPGGVWFVGYDPNDGADLSSTVVRFNTETHDVDASIEVGGKPIAIAGGPAALWVLGYEGRLTRVNLVPA